ncbi:MAG: hypothetical protein ACYS0D_14435 [Planctomycetota bacterium]|jgi:hypothetical protein
MALDARDTLTHDPQAADHAMIQVLLQRLRVMERLIRVIENELADEELDDEQKLQNIGERVADVMDGR